MSMTPNAFEALSAGDKAHRAFVAVSQAANAQALRPGADDTGQALAYALHLLAGYVPATCWPAAPELPPEGADVFDQIAQRAAPQAGAGMSPPPGKAHGVAHAVTTQQPFHVGAGQLFAVQPGVALGDAFAALSLLVGTAREAVEGMAVLMEASESGPRSIADVGAGLAWAPVYLLDMACALQSSIEQGLKAAKGEAP